MQKPEILRSAYGLHLVFVNQRVEGRMPELNEVREMVKRDWAAEQQKRLKDAAYAKLRERYTVEFEEIEGKKAPGVAEAGTIWCLPCNWRRAVVDDVLIRNNRGTRCIQREHAAHTAADNHLRRRNSPWFRERAPRWPLPKRIGWGCSARQSRCSSS